MIRSWFIFITCCFFIPAGYSADIYEVTADNINIRTDSTVQSLSLGTLNKGQRLQAVETRFDWVRVLYPETIQGYVSSTFIRKVSRNKGRVIASRLNIRLRPDLEAPVIGYFSQGEIVRLTGSEGEWFRVQAESGVTGWVNASFLVKKEAAAEKKEDPFDLPSMITLLRDPEMKNKDIVHRTLISQGENVVYDLENYLTGEPDPVIYSIIYIFGALAQKHHTLIDHFFEKIDSSQPRIAAVYLDALQNVLKPSQESKPYFYMAAHDNLDSDAVQEAKAYLFRIYREKSRN